MRRVCLLALLMSSAMLAACGGTGWPDDTANWQDKRREQKGPPTAGELPPGLHDDLPRAAEKTPAPK